MNKKFFKAHKRTIYVDFGYFAPVIKKFQLNLPAMAVDDDNNIECYDEKNERVIPPFLNCLNRGYVCWGGVTHKMTQHATFTAFFSSVFDFSLYNVGIRRYINYAMNFTLCFDNIERNQIENFLTNWQETGSIKLLPYEKGCGEIRY
jgi:hypothetical protein